MTRYYAIHVVGTTYYRIQAGHVNYFSGIGWRYSSGKSPTLERVGRPVSALEVALVCGEL